MVIMVSLVNDGDLFFVIRTRDRTIHVPQKIFPESIIINNIKEYGKERVKDTKEFYINRNSSDMMEVVNFLSGQSYYKSKESVIKDILYEDFKIKSDSKLDIKNEN